MNLKDLAAKLRQLPKVVAGKVTDKAAPEITALAADTFSKSQDAYGSAWAPGADGGEVTLVDTGALSRTLRYVGIGTKLRVALGTRYAKYQIGKRPVFPRAGAALPKAYVKTLEEVANEVIKAELGK